MKIKFLLIVLLFSFQAFAQCYDLGSKRKNYDSYFFVSAGADPIPTEKWINNEVADFTTNGLDLLLKAGYGSDELLFVPIEFYAYYERFNDVGYQQYGVGGYIYTLFLNDKIQALAGGDLGMVNREYSSGTIESDQFLNLAMNLELRYIFLEKFRLGLQFNFEKRDDIAPEIENANYYVASSYLSLYYTF
ncbi:MAG: DUF481 domain-containing protein [Zunongwangia sp.]|uniref:DUF481 domain-containing protein n=1 Tax=Zunongwangia profunda (strain DSM 18752 / CCTCC AB 206139 / SM-A87) TaxID=655815 RepID=D5BAU0_ZUNPS|nr:DUF481 domain-containing protein [Zunongwangia profunda]MAC64223.1 DUF481 domain-containing protein [Flavobacteriaceae bacterium]MAO37285.1 DUF481 domain-containing protein [Zunongwangia sp.]ADF52453.1 hypothetical protein ZPR_2128 [Zunongwangia profunda SM-A87]MAS72149.1 DUF481 domain-containing protein [Zunongwangia sp.]MCC4228086.1 DUF481 domain-containing protein [Zunongwangia profunda]